MFLTVLAFGIMERIWVWLRISYLRRRQKMVAIDYTKETRLHYAFWSYFIEIALFALGIVALAQAFEAPSHTTSKYVRFGVAVFILMLSFVSFMARWKSRVIVGAGKQIGYLGRGSIHIDQIAKYSCNSYFYYITKKDGKVSKIPATLSKSEIVMAFLERATNTKR